MNVSYPTVRLPPVFVGNKLYRRMPLAQVKHLGVVHTVYWAYIDTSYLELGEPLPPAPGVMCTCGSSHCVHKAAFAGWT